MERAAQKSAAASTSSEKWYYIDGGKKCGPIDASELASMLTAGTLAPDTRVWKKGMDKWQPANETDLMELAGSQQAPAAPDKNGEKPAKKRKKRWWIWLIIGILIAILVGAVCAVFAHRKKAAAAPPEEPAVTEAVLHYGLENPVIFENEECAFLIDAVGEKGDYLELDVRCVNKTSDILSFAWKSTSINGSMFDPLWKVFVQGNATLNSSITFPFSSLQSRNLMPGEEIKFVLSVFNETQFANVLEESEKYIARNVVATGKDPFGGCKEVKGYDGWFFSWLTKIDKSGRPYYVAKDKTHVYFDEIRDSEGNMVYEPDKTIEYLAGKFYDDIFGRPYYFNKAGSTVYYDGYGYAFYDKETDRHYYYDENGQIAYYGNNGVPEYHEGTISQEQLDAGKTEKLEKADGHFIVHKEFSIYPTGKKPGEVTRPERVPGENEQVYWDGEKGCFVLLGGTKDVQGYTVHTYVENNTDYYSYFCWDQVTVNGFSAYPDSSMPLRPHSCSYRDILIPVSALQEIEEKLDSDAIEEIGFTIYALGENLNVPLYPIIWEVPPALENEG